VKPGKNAEMEERKEASGKGTHQNLRIRYTQMHTEVGSRMGSHGCKCAVGRANALQRRVEEFDSR
jgi:hypothetical protein